MTLPVHIQGAYFVASVLFILGLRKMSSPVSAKGGIRWAGFGMVLARSLRSLCPVCTTSV